jgi:GPH family glycoside/pentoside/hexuronide:cation symporter
LHGLLEFVMHFLHIIFFLDLRHEYPFGQLNPEAYFPLALTGAIFMVLSLLYSSVSTTNKIENLSNGLIQ